MVPHPDDLIDEEKMNAELARRGLTEIDLAEKLMGLGRSAFSVLCGLPPPGWRARVEAALNLASGALRFKP